MRETRETLFKFTETRKKQIQKIVENMSVMEKIGQLFFVIGQSGSVKELTAFIKKYQPGGMMYRPDNAEKLKDQLRAVQDASTIPLFLSANLESGGNGILTEGTWVGNPMQIAATDCTENAYYLGKIAGLEAARIGINMAFSPIVDIDYNFKNPITNTRTFGSDQKRIIRMAQAQIDGFSESNIIPVIKHFPGDGVDERDQHLLSSINSLSANEWMESYGTIYRQFIEKNVSCIMVGHIYQPAWERKLSPTIRETELMPASCSKLLVNGLLRDTLGFNGLAITDATPMVGYTTIMPHRERLVASINAGIDMLLFNKNIDEDYEVIASAVKEGSIRMERLDEAVARILAVKMYHGLFTEVREETVNSTPKSVIDRTEYQWVTKKIADESITLVKDREKHLPLTPQRYPRIRLVILGDSDDGGFKEGGRVGPLFKAGLEAAGFEVNLFDNKQLDFQEVFEAGVEDLGNKFDLALYVANVETASNQTTVRLDWNHLMAANAPWYEKDLPTIFVSTANPYHLFDIPYVSTFINAYTGNPETVEAVIQKLLGKEPFKGKSPIDPFCGDFLARAK